MWRRRSWSEVNALVGQAEETPSLDFKKAVTTNNEEIAKDIAAMTVNGGVLLYGVDEDRTTRVATAIPRVRLAGLEERLRAIAGSRIAPMPDFDVETVVENERDAEGVVVVVIPPSTLAPIRWGAVTPAGAGLRPTHSTPWALVSPPGAGTKSIRRSVAVGDGPLRERRCAYSRSTSASV